jgi:glycosyltransferase involved in cell wall biosynthesis
MDQAWNIVCFSGVDWHSHRQRPHWLMTAFAERGANVLFVDNLGTRLPRLRDARRIVRRLGGWAKSSRTARPQRERGIRVDSPVVLPLQHLAPVRAIGRATLVRRVRRRLRRIDGPLVVWTYLPLPVIADTAEALRADLLVYDWSDDASEHVLSRSRSQRRRIGEWEAQMAARADLVFVASAELLRSRGSPNERTHVIPHGAPRRARRSRSRPEAPAELADLPRPRVGFVGSISDWIDLELLDAMARERPEWSFVMVGPVKTRVRELRRRPNVTFTGERPHDEIPAYLGAFDVAIIPYRVTPATTAASPLKLREYLAAGLPVVSVDVPEVRPFVPPVRVAAGAGAFLEQIEAALAGGRPRRVSRAGSWDDRAEEMLKLLSEALPARR